MKQNKAFLHHFASQNRAITARLAQKRATRGKNIQDLRGHFAMRGTNFRLRRKCLFSILLQRGIAIFDCKAAALPGRFLPELGCSSEQPFFFGFSIGATRSALSLTPSDPAFATGRLLGVRLAWPQPHPSQLCF